MSPSKLMLVSAVSVLALSACSSTQDKAMPGTTDQVNVTYEYKRDRVQEQIGNIPEWFKEQPEDSDNIFSAGTAVTPDLQFSIDAAVLNAKVILADRINSRMRSQAKQFKAKVGSGDLDASVISEFERAVKNITADTDVSGRQIDPTGGFNSFPNADGDDTTFGYGLAYKYSLSEDLSIVASYMINDLGDTSTGVTGAGIAGMNAGEQLQSEVEITQLTLGFQFRL